MVMRKKDIGMKMWRPPEVTSKQMIRNADEMVSKDRTM